MNTINLKCAMDVQYGYGFQMEKNSKTLKITTVVSSEVLFIYSN